MGQIIIRDLEVHYGVGVTEAERSQPQRLLLCVEMEYDFATAAQTDELTHTIDYYAVTQRLLRFGEGRAWQLIEKLATDVAELILAEFGAQAVTVEVKKFIIPQTAYVAVRLRRPGG